jgi:ABC-type multidrug transport system ATPase subunit/ABC-type transport system involved in multi-copper enzyme maturation permease subunit
MSDAALRLCGIEKRFRRHAALRGVSLHVRRGDCYGFLGHNGAGKTTALRIALGLIRPDAGRVLVDGFDAARHPREARARQGGLIETPGFYAWMSGRKNLALLGRLSGLPGREAKRESERLLEAVGLSHAGDRRVGGYSQGMRQRLGIAQALLGDPGLVLLDEPMNGLDPEGIEEFRRLIVHLARDEGRTVLLSSHQIHEVAEICNRVGILREGRLLVEAETADLVGDDRRLVLRTNEDARAAALLADRGVETAPRDGEGLELTVGSDRSGEIARLVVEAGLEVRELAPRPVSLEEIYLRYSRGEETEAAVAPEPKVEAVAPPAPRRAPSVPVLRVLGVDQRKQLSHLGPPIALLLPAVLAAISVARQWARSAGHLRQVETGELFSHSLVTAFEAAAVALGAALPAAALVLAGLASQSVAGELSRGTLRNLLLRPVGRLPLGLGKALSVAATALVAYGLVALVAVGGSALAFDFTDVVEILEIRTAEPFVLVSAGELWPVFARAVPAMILPLLAYAALGFLAGALARGSAMALALGTGFVVVLDLLRAAGREFGFERFLLSAHFPSPLGDTSYLAHLLDRVRAPNDPPGGYLDGTVIVPLAWLVGAVLLAVLLLRRRSVP